MSLTHFKLQFDVRNNKRVDSDSNQWDNNAQLSAQRTMKTIRGFHTHERNKKTQKVVHEFHSPLRELIRIKARSGFSSIFASTFVTCKLFFYPYYWLTLLQCHHHFGCVCCVVKWIRRNKYWRVTLFCFCGRQTYWNL